MFFLIAGHIYIYCFVLGTKYVLRSFMRLVVILEHGTRFICTSDGIRMCENLPDQLLNIAVLDSLSYNI